MCHSSRSSEPGSHGFEACSSAKCTKTLVGRCVNLNSKHPAPETMSLPLSLSSVGGKIKYIIDWKKFPNVNLESLLFIWSPNECQIM